MSRSATIRQSDVNTLTPGLAPLEKSDEGNQLVERRGETNILILLAELCNCFKDCDPQAKMTGRNYWCRHLIYHLHNGPQDLRKKPSASYDAGGWWRTDYRWSLPGEEDHVWCVIMYFSQKPNFGPSSQPAIQLSHKTIPTTKCEDHNVFSQESQNWNF